MTFVFAAAAILWFSLAPSMADTGVAHIDKLEHFAAYAGLTTIGFAVRQRPWPAAAVAIVAFGCGVEVLQVLAPTGRTGSVLDALANAAGAGAAWAGWVVWTRARRS